MVRRIEWIGVRSPLQDERIVYRKIHHLYTDDEEVLLEAIAGLLAPLIRQYGSTARAKGKVDGYSKEYLWGPRHFVQEMPDIDADRLFRQDPDEYEYRDLGESAHDAREPVVPWSYITASLNRIMIEAANGPEVVLKGQRVAHTDLDAARLVEQWQTDRFDQARDHGLKVDPQTMRISR